MTFQDQFKDYKVVDRFDGSFYDVEVTAGLTGELDEESPYRKWSILKRICKKLRRMACLNHKWVHGFLMWRWPYFLEGTFCYCHCCKKIECGHDFGESEEKYVVNHSPVFCTTYKVGTCKICKKRINFSRSAHNDVDAAYSLLDDYWKNSHNGQAFRDAPLGYGFFVELPIYIADVICRQGLETAKSEVKRWLDKKDIGELMYGVGI
jgi:hypothetical protein